MKLPRKFTTFASLSKYVAMALFLALPIIGFFLGMLYQRDLMENISPPTPENTHLDVSPSPMSYHPSNPDTSCQRNDDCILFDTRYRKPALFCCPQQCINFYADTVIAVSKQWLSERDKQICNPTITCPQEPGFGCIRQVSESYNHIKAVCSSGICKKVMY